MPTAQRSGPFLWFQQGSESCASVNQGKVNIGKVRSASSMYAGSEVGRIAACGSNRKKQLEPNEKGGHGSHENRTPSKTVSPYLRERRVAGQGSLWLQQEGQVRREKGLRDWVLMHHQAPVTRQNTHCMRRKWRTREIGLLGLRVATHKHQSQDSKPLPQTWTLPGPPLSTGAFPCCWKKSATRHISPQPLVGQCVCLHVSRTFYRPECLVKVNSDVRISNR